MIRKYKKRLKKYIYEMLSAKRSEHSIALGFSIGSFFCILPTIGFTLWLFILISLIFKKINKLALFGSLVVWNPLLLFPIYYLAYKLGNLIYGTAPVVSYNVVFTYHIYNVSRRFLAGDLILAVIISVAGYFIVRVVMKKYKKQILKKLKINGKNLNKSINN